MTKAKNLSLSAAKAFTDAAAAEVFEEFREMDKDQPAVPDIDQRAVKATTDYAAAAQELSDLYLRMLNARGLVDWTAKP